METSSCWLTSSGPTTSPSVGHRASENHQSCTTLLKRERKFSFDLTNWRNVSHFSKPGPSSQGVIQGSDWYLSQLQHTSPLSYSRLQCDLHDLTFFLCVCVWHRYKWGHLWRFLSSAQYFKQPQLMDQTRAGTKSCSCPLGEQLWTSWAGLLYAVIRTYVVQVQGRSSIFIQLKPPECDRKWVNYKVL